MNRLPLSALNRKLLRDLTGMKGQALAIALVTMAGVAMFVAYLSNFESLQRTVDVYYERQRLGDVFASLVRAPARLETALASIPGVEAVETRIVVDVTIDVPGLDEPAAGRLVSIPARGRPRLNDVYLREGRWPEPGRPDEVLASEAFIRAHGSRPGAGVDAIINGRRRSFTIVGVALSPEYVYSTRPGEIIPDDRRFGIFWMERRALATAFDMEGGFNDVSLRLARGASADEVVAHVDRLLAPYGGIGAVPRSMQPSVWTLNSELTQLRTFGFITPAIFLAVAAFILNVALARALTLQRPQLAALKALGYSNRELAWHYVKWALVIAGAGGIAGIAVGAWLGALMIELYNQYFRFPALDYALSPLVALGALGIALGAAAGGAAGAVGRAVRIPPAEAMRPEPPHRFGKGVIETPWLERRLGYAARMVLRTLERRPGRSLASSIGIALGGAILLVGLGFIEAMDALITRQFVQAMRQDVTVTFVEPRSPGVVHEALRLPGVVRVEAQRMVPARLRARHRSRTLAVTGVDPSASLSRIVAIDGRIHQVPPGGLLLSRALADVLRVGPGDEVVVEVLEGRRPVRDIAVAGIVDDMMGLQAYMPIEALHRLMREGGVVSAVHLQVDRAGLDALYSRLKATPAVAGVTLREAALRNFRDVLAQNMSLMIGITVIFAAIIAVGVVYNAARISLSERSRELASLRVLGYTRAEISSILLGELAVLTVVSLPIGTGIGYVLGRIITAGFESEVYRFPFVVTPAAVAWMWLTMLGAAALSGLLVRRRLDRLDLVAVLKTRE